MRINGKLSRIICLVLVVAMAVALAFTLTTSAADDVQTKEVVFELGENAASAEHKDGSTDKATYSETVDGYTLSITGGTKCYPGSYDATGKSCIKLGTGSKTGGFSFTVPDDVTSVIINVAGYKAKTVGLNVNGTEYSITSLSNNGAYDAIKVDTTSTKTVSLVTSTNYRAMVNSIVFVIPSSCGHLNTTTTTTEATCTEAGKEIITCNDCGATVSTVEVSPATNHPNKTTTTTEATCTEDGVTTVTCNDCEAIVSEETVEDALGHNYVRHVCTRCGEDEPTEETIDFSTTDQRDSLSTSQQVWSNGGVTLTHDKASSTTNIADYSNPVRLYKSSKITITSTSEKNIAKIVFECTSGYVFAPSDSDDFTVTTNGTTVTVEFVTAVKEYAFTLGAQTRFNSLTVYYEQLPTISEASVTLGTNLAMNYTVVVPEGYDVNGMKMVFTMNGVETVVDTYTTDAAGNAVFTFNRLAPQCMGDSIDAVLYVGDKVVDSYEGYSVKAYAEQLLVDYADNADVVKLVVDMLNYGAAAQAYRGYKTDALVNAGIDAEGSNVNPAEADKQNSATQSTNSAYTAYSVGVRFDYINKIFFRFNAISLEGVTVTDADGNELNISSIGNGKYVAYSNAISALEFDEVVTFNLNVNGETVQTITYSVNTYAFNKVNTESEIADLALALYRYGKSAAAYAANN